MNSVVAEPSKSFINDVYVTMFAEGEVIGDEQGFRRDRFPSNVGEHVRRSELPRVDLPRVELDDELVSLHIPTRYRGELTSVATLVAHRSPDTAGVFEIWTPIGEYSDLKLTAGYFGRLERFQNVSSYVRFENGVGLPGQAWALGHAIIHDGLSHHQGFQRAAGASADELETAVGIPLFAEEFEATVAFISSRTTPLAARIEVWLPNSKSTLQLAYCAGVRAQNPTPGVLDDLKVGATCDANRGILGLVALQHSAVFCTDSEALELGRPSHHLTSVVSGLAIPTYRDTSLRSITILLFAN